MIYLIAFLVNTNSMILGKRAFMRMKKWPSSNIGVADFNSRAYGLADTHFKARKAGSR